MSAGLFIALVVAAIFVGDFFGRCTIQAPGTVGKHYLVVAVGWTDLPGELIALALP